MKNQIEYFYNLIIDEIRLIQNEYYFNIGNESYIFLPVAKEVNYVSIYSLQNLFLSLNSNIHEIRLNKDKSIVSMIHNEPYILLKVNLRANKIMNLQDILDSVTIVSNVPLKISWKELWEQKVDQFESYIDYLEEKNLKLREYYDYFIGLSEIAIEYLNFYDEKERDAPVLAHRRMKCYEDLFDYYNPLNIVIDDFSRDLAEYLKVRFFSGKKEENFSFLDQLSKNNMILLFARMLFPTYFYDLFESEKEYKEKDFIALVEKMDRYEIYLKELFYEIKKRTEVPSIAWLS